MEWFASIFHFFFDKERSIPKKFLMAALIIAVIYFADDATGFSYYYHSQQKINQVTAINNILKDPITDSVTHKLLIALRNKLALRQSLKARIEDYTLSMLNTNHNTDEQIKY